MDSKDFHFHGALNPMESLLLCFKPWEFHFSLQEGKL